MLAIERKVSAYLPVTDARPAPLSEVAAPTALTAPPSPGREPQATEEEIGGEGEEAGARGGPV